MKADTPCPSCGSHNVTVVLSKQGKRQFRIRRRHCLDCEHRFYTAQPPEHVIAGTHAFLHPLYRWYAPCASSLTPKPSSFAA